jgi:uncharacterized protein (DUF488 family)
MMTLGYEGLKLEQFFDILCANNVQTIVDVREVPFSRKPGFSKPALAKQAEIYNIGYTHVVELGCPRAIRYDYRQDKDWERYCRRFEAYLDTQVDIIAALAGRAITEECCLVCFEADYNLCHRTLVAQRVVARFAATMPVIHLGIRSPKQAAFADAAAI